jgi:hypothetical protein
MRARPHLWGGLSMFDTSVKARKLRNHHRATRCDATGTRRIEYHRRLCCEPLEERTLLDASMAFHPMVLDPIAGAGPATNLVGSTSPIGFTPQQIRTAYGIDSIPLGSLVGYGAGQTIAIVAVYDNPKLVSSTNSGFLQSDLHQFDVAFGLPDPPSFIKLDEHGGTNYPGVDPAGPGAEKSMEGEAALDVEWAHAIAPQANIVLVEAAGWTVGDISAAINTARSAAGVSVVSMSFGWPEADHDAALDPLFVTPPGHQGVTFVAASGDDGPPGAYPAYSPNVVAIGGTSLRIKADNTYSGETGWSGSGGGQSTRETEPSWQNAVQSSGFRQIPDVAFDADPNTGVAMYDSYDLGSRPWCQMGGTSLGAPCWAGLIAIANQIRAGQGLGSLDGPSQTLPGLYALPPSDFYDITSGGSGGVSAVLGYDEVTGLGSPVANELVSDLASLKKASPPTITGTTPSLTDGTLSAGAIQLLVEFSSPVFGGNTVTNFDLRGLGLDGLLGTADDVLVPLTVSSSGNTSTLSFSALPENVYRLTVHDTITDTRGNKLDGNGDGEAGGDWAVDFVAILTDVYDPPLPVALTSPHATLFDVATGAFGTGEFVQGGNNGSTNVFNGYGRLVVGGVLFQPSSSSSSISDSGQSVVTGNGTFSGLTISRKITVPKTGNEDFARTIDTFTNPTGAPITATVQIVGNLGSDAGTTVFATSDGDTTVEPGDRWVGTDGNGTPAVIHFIHGPGGLKPSSVGLTGDNIQWTYNLTVPAGQTVQLAYFTIVGSSTAEAVAAADALVTRAGFGGQATAFLSSSDAAALANFQFPPVSATVSLDTHAPQTNDVLTATATIANGNGDPVTLTYVWKVNGTVRRIFTSATALSDTFDLSLAGNGSYGDTVSVELTPTDGSVSGTTVADTATVADTSPTDIVLAGASVPENQPAGTAVGTFSTADPDAADTFTYTLATGTGSTDNASFTVSGNTLKTAASFDHEAKSSRSIRIRSTDQGGLYTEKVFAIAVTNVSELPAASVTTPSGPQSGNVTIGYNLTDAESDLCSILVQYSPDEGANWQTATAVAGQGDGTTGLTSGPSGTSHTFVWASGSDIVHATNSNVKVRITPTDTVSGTAGTSGIFTVDNYHVTVSTSTIGLCDPTPSVFYLRNANNSGYADVVAAYGPGNSGWMPVAGDWNKDGVGTIGLYDPATSVFYLRNTNDGGYADVAFAYGPPGAGWLPMAGDWNGDGTDTIGLYDPATSVFYLRNTNDGGYADVAFAYGPPGAGWLPMTGNWSGGNQDTIGLYDPATSVFYLRNTNSSGYADVAFAYGPGGAGWKPIAGDWNADSTGTIGLYSPTTSVFYLRNTNDGGYADVAFAYGPPNGGWTPIVGDWNGLGSPLKAAGGLAAGSTTVPALGQAELQPIVREAVARWASAGLDAAALAKLTQVQFVIGDLPGSYLGQSQANRVYLDRTAAGHGWFVDPTPAQDEEFGALGGRQALKAVDPRAVDRIDLLTVVEHELGHCLGLSDLSSSVDELMSGTLSAGLRRQAVAADVDAMLANYGPQASRG